jgi:tetratricopeptide (TPR) repeat protein
LRLRLASLLYKTGNFREAVAQYRQVLIRQPDSSEALNNAAWLLATCPDAAVRNGAEAVRFARRACRLTQYQNAGMVGTLAAAYAEDRRFADAVATAEKAVALSTAAGETQFTAVNQQLLTLYRAGKPFHGPPRDATSNSPP